MTVPPATIGPSAYWYLTRSTGWVSLLLLTAAVVLGVLQVNRWNSDRWPRFAVRGLHRYVSLLALAFLAVHIITAVLDSFAPISLLDAVVPFAGSYRPLWLGFGAVAFDLMLAVVITSLMRRHIGYRSWRVVHWLSYACWPVALLHALGTGSDVKSVWSLALTALCVVAVTAAVGVRAVGGWPEHAPLRGGTLALAALAPLALILWLPSGPLGSGWARRAGTPAALLPSAAASAASGTPAAGAESLARGFTASLSGTIEQGPGHASGQTAVQISATLTGGASGRLAIELDGQGLPGGGVAMRHSRVELDSPSAGVSYRGAIVAIDGGRLLATVSDSAGHRLTLQMALDVTGQAGSVTGTVAASPVRAQG